MKATKDGWTIEGNVNEIKRLIDNSISKKMSKKHRNAIGNAIKKAWKRKR